MGCVRTGLNGTHLNIPKLPQSRVLLLEKAKGKKKLIKSSCALSSSEDDDDMPAIAETSDKGSDSELEELEEEEEEEEEEVEEEEDAEEEEEEVEEEEDEYEEEVQEEEEDADGDGDGDGDVDEGDEDKSDDDRKDSSPENESEGHDEDLKSEGSLASVTHTVEDNGGQCHSFTPSNELLASQNRDSKVKISKNDLASSKDNGFPESIVGSINVGVQSEKKAAMEVSGNAKLLDKDLSGNEAYLNSSRSLDAVEIKSSSCNKKEVVAETWVSSGIKVSNIDLYSDGKTRQSGEDIKLRASSINTPQLRPRSLSPGADIEERNKRPAILCDFFAKGWCIKGSSCKFLHQKDGANSTSHLVKGDEALEHTKGELPEDAGLRLKAEMSGASSTEPLTSSVANYSSLRSHFSLERILPGEHGESQSSSHIPLFQDNLNHRFDHMDNKRTMSEEFARGFPLARNTSLPDYGFFSSGSVSSSSTYGLTSPRFTSSLNSSFNPPLVSSGVSTNHPFAYRRNTPSQGSSPLKFQTPLDNDRGYYAYRYNWEPSVPFRPSFNFSSTLVPSPRTQYDPLLDSIELPNVGDRSFQPSSINQGDRIQTASHQQANGDLVSSDHRTQGDVSDNNIYTHDTDACMAATEATCAYLDGQPSKSSIQEEEKSLKHDPNVNASDANDLSFDHNLGQVDEVKPNKESKALKCFRASLVDLVKELVKPSWREGHLSKDAHKMIVRKAVDKVLGTLQPHQIPITPELTNQYLSSSRPKLTKLVEGYVSKYGKP